MKNTIILLISFLLVLSCKKTCYECSNICYTCPSLSNSLQCSDDYPNKILFNKAIELIEQNGINCFKINPTIVFEECEIEKVNIFNDEEYDCIKK